MLLHADTIADDLKFIKNTIQGKEDTKYYQTWDLFYQWLEGPLYRLGVYCIVIVLTNDYKLYPGGTMLNQHGWILYIKKNLKKKLQILSVGSEILSFLR